VVCFTESSHAQTGLIVYRFLVACPVDDNRDVSSGPETDSDLESEEDVEDLEVAETSTFGSL